jgi:hypothetical protein
MMKINSFDFSSPSAYGDWANYAGFDRKTGEMTSSIPAEGIKPPENFDELISQKADSLMKPLNAIAPAMAQFSQGNMMQGINTLRGIKPKQPTATPAVPGSPTTPAVVDTSVHDYTYGID